MKLGNKQKKTLIRLCRCTGDLRLCCSHIALTAAQIIFSGTGSIVAAIKIPAHREPLVVGKPGKLMFDMLHETHGLEPDRTLMVGDRFVYSYVEDNCLLTKH